MSSSSTVTWTVMSAAARPMIAKTRAATSTTATASLRDIKQPPPLTRILELPSVTSARHLENRQPFAPKPLAAAAVEG
jgi:hypothetical protein